MNSTRALDATIAESSHHEGIAGVEAAVDEMARMVTGLNIERFHKKLAEEPDEGMRQKLLRLLAEEEAKFVALMIPFSAVYTENRNPNVMVMESAEKRV